VRTLVVTVDPARRLADAMGVPIGTQAHPVRIDDAAGERLFALMPEPHGAARAFIRYLFQDEPEACARVLENSVFTVLEGALAGVHDLLSILLIAQAEEEERFGAVVVDTAPSRHALDLVTAPGRLASLLEGRTLGWLGTLAQRASPTAPGSVPPSGGDRGGALGWGRRKVEDALAGLFGPRMLRDLTDLFADLTRVRVRFSALAREAEAILLGVDTRFLLVAAPTGAARADVHFLARRLEKLQRSPAAVVLNRADVGPPAWARTLSADPHESPAVRAAVAQLETERGARTQAADAMAGELSRRYPGLGQVRLPAVAALHPSEIVRALARELDAALPMLLGHAL
jgi:anion-transporting  ArsA/GET3 family ATPase